MRDEKRIRWLGVISAFVVLSIIGFGSDYRSSFLGISPDSAEILPYLALGLLPAFLALILSALAHFWWAFCLGLYLLFISVLLCIDSEASPISMLLIIAVATVCINPFLNRAFHREHNTDEDPNQ
jgi:hypothetical protein